MTHIAARPSHRLIIVALVFATFSEGIELGVVPAVIPGIGKLFGVPAGPLNFVNGVQLLSLVITTPIFARLGDLHGHRKLLRAAVLCTFVGAVLCAVAPSFAVLLLGRVLQGPMGALTALAIGIARDRLDPDELKIAIGSVVAGLAGGSTLGLLIAAEVFSASSSVRAVLWIPAAGLALSLVLLYVFVPETVVRARGRLDWVGAFMLGTGLTLLIIVLGKGASWGLTSPATLGYLAGALALLAIFVWIELRVANPMIDIRVVSSRALAPFYVASLTIGCAFYGAQSATATFLASPREKLGYGFGLDLTHLAFVLIPPSLAVITGAMLVAPLTKALGHKRSVYAGCTVMAAGYACMAPWHGELWQLVATNCVAALGIGMVAGAMPVVLAERSARTSTGIATSLFTTFRAIGGTAAAALFADVLTAMALPNTTIPRESGYVAVWLICGAASLVSLLVVMAAGETACGSPAQSQNLISR